MNTFAKGATIILLTGALYLPTGSAQTAQSSISENSDGRFTLDIQYTGRLLGYFRQEASPKQQNCVVQAITNAEPVIPCTDPGARLKYLSTPEIMDRVKQFWCATQGSPDLSRCTLADDHPGLLVGMGDNFAPQLPARLRSIWWDARTKTFLPTTYDAQCNLLPLQAFGYTGTTGIARIRYVAGANCEPGPPTIINALEDNVANFLLLSGYKALVPGREDFQYGALWLLQLADQLRGRSDTEEGLHLLAANLRVASSAGKQSSSAADKKSSSNSSPCPLFFDPALVNKFFGTAKADPLLRPCDPAMASADNQKGSGYIIVTVKDKDGIKRNVLIVGLVDGSNAEDPTADFSREIASDKKTLLDPNCSPTTNPANCRYKLVVTRPSDELRRILYATMGQPIDFRLVLAQMPRSSAVDLATTFGRRERTCAQEDTNGKVASPVTFDYSRVAPGAGKNFVDDDFECEGSTPKSGSSSGNISYLPVTLPAINIVISEAQDGRGTENETINYIQDPNLEHTRAYLATPHSGYDTDLQKLMQPLSVLEATVPIDARSSADTTASFTNSGQWYDSKEGPGPPPAGQYCNPAITPATDPESRRKRQEMARFCIVSTLQAATKADVAMLQNRDIYLGGTLLAADDGSIDALCNATSARDNCHNIARLEEILWKDDTPTVVDLSGQQLRATLAASATLYANDQRSEDRDVAGEWAYTFGIVVPGGQSQYTKAPGVTKATRATAQDYSHARFFASSLCNDDPGQTKGSTTGSGGSGAAPSSPTTVYCIDGVPLDDARIYHVATSAALATNGAIFSGISARNAGAETDLRGSPGPELSNVILAGPHVSSLAEPILTTPQIYKEMRTEEENHQQRRLFHINLQNAEGSYAMYHPNLSAVELSDVFGGVTDSRVTKQATSQWVGTDNLRVLWEGGHFDFGGLQTLDFNRATTGNPQGGLPTVNYTANLFTVGPLLQLHLGPHLYKPFDHPSKGLQDWKLTISPALFQTQVLGNTFPFNYDSAFKTLSPNQTSYVAQPQIGLASRMGLRYEFNDGGLWPDKNSYFEAGLQHIWIPNALDSISLHDGTTFYPCILTASLSFTQCVKNLQTQNPKSIIVSPHTTFTGGYSELNPYGLYLDTYLSESVRPLKLPAGLVSVIFQAKGDYFFRHTYPNSYASQTYYDFNPSISLMFPIIGNLSIGPKYGVFLYENFNTWQSLTANSYTIDIRYSLNYYRPVKFKGILQYKAPQAPPPPTATSSSSVGPQANGGQ